MGAHVAGDHELWERIRERDASAFEAFYRENAVRLCAYLRQIVGNAQAAEDVMQETFTQMWRSPNGFRPDLGTLRGYLFGIGRKRAAEWWRKRERAPEQQGEKRVEESAEGTASFSAIGDAFARLAEDQRSLLWLREVEGQSYAELAEILQIPVGTVKSRLFAAREELRRIWRSSGSGARSKK
jgi:RNA polymerase sigma-70 factor (ECF subfamily)